MLALLSMLVAAPATCSAASPQHETRVYVPIGAPTVEHAPRTTQAPATHTRVRRAAPARAAAAVASSARSAARVPLLQLPHTSVPIWWAMLLLLAVPLARAWRGWTARMFV